MKNNDFSYLLVLFSFLSIGSHSFAQQGSALGQHQSCRTDKKIDTTMVHQKEGVLQQIKEEQKNLRALKETLATKKVILASKNIRFAAIRKIEDFEYPILNSDQANDEKIKKEAEDFFATQVEIAKVTQKLVDLGGQLHEIEKVCHTLSAPEGRQYKGSGGRPDLHAAPQRSGQPKFYLEKPQSSDQKPEYLERPEPSNR